MITQNNIVELPPAPVLKAKLFQKTEKSGRSNCILPILQIIGISDSYQVLKSWDHNFYYLSNNLCWAYNYYSLSSWYF